MHATLRAPCSPPSSKLHLAASVPSVTTPWTPAHKSVSAQPLKRLGSHTGLHAASAPLCKTLSFQLPAPQLTPSGTPQPINKPFWVPSEPPLLGKGSVGPCFCTPCGSTQASVDGCVPQISEHTHTRPSPPQPLAQSVVFARINACCQTFFCCPSSRTEHLALTLCLVLNQGRRVSPGKSTPRLLAVCKSGPLPLSLGMEVGN